MPVPPPYWEVPYMLKLTWLLSLLGVYASIIVGNGTAATLFYIAGVASIIAWGVDFYFPSKGK